MNNASTEWLPGVMAILGVLAMLAIGYMIADYFDKRGK